jgi:tetratricopeptide (TPR) repeat protein
MSDEIKEIGKYQVIERVTGRSSGQVYKVSDPESGKEMTLRMLPAELATDDESVERFKHEVEGASKVRHRNVARVLDHGLESGRLYYVTELVEAPTLRRTLKKRRLSLQEVFLVFKQIAQGIGAIHAQGIVHRDLNSSNIVVSEDLSLVKLSSFGVTRSSASPTSTVTATATATGGLNYVSPEAAVDGGDVDERSDIYSLGALFYEMLIGKAPFGKFNLPSRADSNVPDSVDPVVLKCLEANPANRYSNVPQLLGEIDRLEDRLGLGLVSELKGISRTIAKPARGVMENRGLLIGVGAAIAVAAGAFFLLRGDGSSPQAETAEPVAVAVQAAPVEEVVEDVGVQDDLEEEEAQAEEVEPEATTPAPAEETSPPPTPAPAQPRANRGPDLGMALEIATEKARNGLLDQALADIEPLVSANVSASIASEALFLRARVEEAQRRFGDAQATYTEIQARFDEAETKARAGYRFGRSAVDSGDTGRHPAAIRKFQEVARLYPDTEYAPRALAAVAAMQSAAKTQTEDAELGKRVPSAFVTSKELIARYPRDGAAERAYWLVGETYDDLKLYQEAVGAFSQLVAHFPETEYEVWWRIGQLYDRRLDEKTRAIGAYGNVPEGSEHYNDAQKRIARLSR